jgi:hypothetical protein
VCSPGRVAALGAWVACLQITAAPRETYRTDFFDAVPGQEVFDVAFPVQ